jgi:hypothetical protein
MNSAGHPHMNRIAFDGAHGPVFSVLAVAVRLIPAVLDDVNRALSRDRPARPVSDHHGPLVNTDEPCAARRTTVDLRRPVPPNAERILSAWASRAPSTMALQLATSSGGSRQMRKASRRGDRS